MLGFEAASRGATQVLMVEHDAALVAQLRQLQDPARRARRCTSQRGDGVMALKKATPGTLELIFLDPPFDSALFEKALAAAAHAASPDGFIYLEAPSAWTDEALQPLGCDCTATSRPARCTRTCWCAWPDASPAGAHRLISHLSLPAVSSRPNEESSP